VPNGSESLFHGDNTGSNPVGDANKTKYFPDFLSLPLRFR